MKKHILLLFLLCVSFSFAQKISPPFINNNSSAWADSVLQTLSLDQKIGQLFMPEVQSVWPQKDLDSLAAIIRDYHVGSIIVFKGGPYRQANAINYLQTQAKIPLLVSIDGEWGLSMRMDSTIRFPRQMTLSAIKNDSLIYEMGREIGRQCRRMGIHLNFAPDVDINNNPLNPVIGTRSFSDDKYIVANRGLLYMKGMQDENVLACAKHFPGHGDTDTDSHYALPVIDKDSASIDSVELFPFKTLIDNGVGSVMMAHLNLPKVDSTLNDVSSLSRKFTTGWLKQALGFKGLVLTDALMMKGVANTNDSGKADVKALMAGNDILLMSENIPLAFERIKNAVADKKITEKELNAHVKKILMLKHWVGLNNFKPIDTTNIYTDLNSPGARYLNYSLYEKALTVLTNKNQTLPLTHYQSKKIAFVAINDSLNNTLQQMAEMFAAIKKFSLAKDASEADINNLVEKLSGFDLTVISIHNTSTKPGINFGITDAMNTAIRKISDKTAAIVCLFGNSYCISKLAIPQSVKAFTISYEDTYLPQYLTAQLLFGAAPAKGTLPVKPTADFNRGDGILTNTVADVLKYTLPEETGIKAENLVAVDSIVNDAIQKKAFPGCQVFASLNGKVFMQKSYGTTTYDSTLKVANNMLYDIASVTKITSTALAAMWLYEKGMLDVSKPISYYLPEFKKSNKKNITIDEMLTHRAGLQAWIPFYESHMDKNGKLSKKAFSKKPKGHYTISVADSLYMNTGCTAKMWRQLLASSLGEKGKYVYSDLGLLILQRIIEKITGETIDKTVTDNFYSRLGLSRLAFNPLGRFTKNDIVPTENDTTFRRQLLQGYVHDPAAAMLGGVAGNAGLFANAQNTGVIMQMLINGGNYAGQQFLNKATIDYFTSAHFEGNRRGFIFDKAEADITKPSPCARSASASTFGHQGFTGTCTWADPQTGLVFVFLSNRVYPVSTNSKINELSVRTKVQQALYDALIR